MYSAKEAAEITGLSTATLRYYEREKLIPQITRTPGGHSERSFGGRRSPAANDEQRRFMVLELYCRKAERKRR